MVDRFVIVILIGMILILWLIWVGMLWFFC